MATKLAGAMAVLAVGIALGSLIGPALGDGRGSGGSTTAGVGAADETKVVISKDYSITTDNLNGGAVFCPQGYEAVGGGVDTGGGWATMSPTMSAPVFGPRDNFKSALEKGKGTYRAATGWEAYAFNSDDETRPVNISVICTRK